MPLVTAGANQDSPPLRLPTVLWATSCRVQHLRMAPSPVYSTTRCVRYWAQRMSSW